MTDNTNPKPIRRRCANCKYQNLTFDEYPCVKCVRNPNTKEDMWKYENE